MQSTPICVALVANSAWSVYNFRLGVVRTLIANGYRVVVIAPDDDFAQRLMDEGAEFYHVGIASMGRNPLTDLWLLKDLRGLYKRLKLDFVFHYTIKPNIFGTLAAYGLGIPSVSIVVGAGYALSERNMIFYIVKYLYKLTNRLNKELWLINHDDPQFFIKEGMVGAWKVRELPGEGVDTGYFTPRSVEKTAKTKFLLAARLLWDKGVGIFVDAARIVKAKHPHTHFQLLGFVEVQNPHAISREQIHHWQQEGVVEYLGVTDDVRPYYAAADIFVLPSFYREGTSRSLLEAASMCMPIITTDNVGCRDIVEDGKNGFICAPRSVEGLVVAIERMIGCDEEQRRAMGVYGRKKVIAEFDEHFVLPFYLDALVRYCPRK